MQTVLAAGRLLFAILAWLSGAGLPWLFGDILLGLVIPYTLVVIRPTNKRLLAPNLDKNAEEARRLLRRWGRLHAVRSVLSCLALVVFLLNI